MGQQLTKYLKIKMIKKNKIIYENYLEIDINMKLNIIKFQLKLNFNIYYL